MLGIIIMHGSASLIPIYELYQVGSKPVCTGLMWLRLSGCTISLMWEWVVLCVPLKSILP